MDYSSASPVLTDCHCGQVHASPCGLIQTHLTILSFTLFKVVAGVSVYVQNLAKIILIRCHMWTKERNFILLMPVWSKKDERIAMG